MCVFYVIIVFNLLINLTQCEFVSQERYRKKRQLIVFIIIKTKLLIGLGNDVKYKCTF